MPTLAEYEARGIDITTKTQEQLRAEGYVTPYNEMPVIITKPGVYKTRSGKKVEIHEVKPTLTLSSTAFNAKGCLIKVGRFRTERLFNVWHISGRFGIFGPTPNDIIGKWEDKHGVP